MRFGAVQSRSARARLGIVWAITSVALCSAIPPTHADSYPDHTVQMVAPSSPGGGVDTVARIIAHKLSQYFHQDVVVINRPGAAGRVGGGYLARSAPDGYTIALVGSSFTSFPALYKHMSFSVSRDLAPVTQVITLANVLVSNPSLPVKTIGQLIAFAKKRPGQLNYASAGIGSNPHLSMALFLKMTGLKMLHVPYKGIGPGLIDVTAGRVALMMPNVLTALPLIQGGKVRAYGVTSLERCPALPNVPAIAETVPGYEAIQWYGVFAPAGTPPEILDKVSADIARALRDPQVREHFLKNGAIPVGDTPQQFKAIVHADLKKWAQVVRDAGIKPE